MKTETEIENQETEGEGTLPPSEGHKMQTYSRLIDEPDSDKLSRIESILDQISAKLGDEDENRAGYENMLDFFNTYCEANGKDKDSVVEAMLWMRDRIMKEMKYIISDANIGNRAIIPCCDECDAGMDVDIIEEHIKSGIMDMF